MLATMYYPNHSALLIQSSIKTEVTNMWQWLWSCCCWHNTMSEACCFSSAGPNRVQSRAPRRSHHQYSPGQTVRQPAGTKPHPSHWTLFSGTGEDVRPNSVSAFWVPRTFECCMNDGTNGCWVMNIKTVNVLKQKLQYELNVTQRYQKEKPCLLFGSFLTLKHQHR